MKFFTLTKNNIALIVVAIVAIGFFVAGLFKVLDNFLVKALFFMGYGALLITALYFALFGQQKNRPEDVPQDDSH